MEGEPLLDLCHLSEVEQTVILNVLQRDAELRNKEERRIRKLQQTVSDPLHLRSLSGAWFNEERSKRYQKGGADVVNASIRHKKREKDIPLSGIFDKEKGNFSQLHKQHEEDKSTERELQENVSVREDDKSQEEKEREKDGESPIPMVTPEQQSRTRHITKSNAAKENGLKESVQKSGDKERRILPSVSPSLQMDSEGDVDSGSTELDYTRFGSVSSLASHHMMNGSLMSLYSVGDFGDVVVSGRIQFSLQYDVKKEELHVHILRCQELASARKNRSDPYVKVYLLPDNTSRSKKKTAVKRKTLNPVYDENMRYKVRRLDLQARVLSLSVWHMERMRRNLFLGEVEVRLGQWDWSQSQPTWHNLQPRVKLSPDDIISRGTILFSIKFVPPGSEGSGCPPTGELHIWLREIVGLLPTKRGAPSTYVKSVVLPDESGVSGQQTRVVRGSVNPVFNHTMVYDGFQSSDLIQACAEITVWSSHPSSCLGGVRLSTGSGELSAPYSELKEPFEAWYDLEGNRSRIDYQDGTVRTFLNGNDLDYGAIYTITPVTNETEIQAIKCFQLKGTKEDPIHPQAPLPDLQGFEFEKMENHADVLCEVWKKVAQAGHKKNTYRLWVTRPEGNDSPAIPHRFEMEGFNTLLESHNDKYTIDYSDFSSQTESDIFTRPEEMYSKEFPNPIEEHQILANPIQDYVSTSPISHAHRLFGPFKKKFKRQYRSEKEHEERENIFVHTLRYVHSTNRAGHTFSVGINHFADQKKEELAMMTGGLLLPL
ncbi:synaptotagmin 1 isoform X1 [Labeo rohita]|uniref:Synaptotagmin 1 isoform X1 n=1 Tax=Labeo rohita TaxID=84645 RepID=A0A498MZJ7_LABRO|nr:synaptotagmin 1 isoform X1 [Labeo rohita]